MTQHQPSPRPTPVRSEVLDRPLPHNLEAERSVLGAIILDNAALSVAVRNLAAADFFLPQHKYIFTAMFDLANEGAPIDTISLIEHLTRHNDLEAAGGVAYLSQLPDGLPRVTNVEHYAQIVARKAALRSVAYAASAIQEQALAESEDATAILDRAREQLDAMRSRIASATEPAARSIFHSFADFESAPPLRFAIRNLLQLDGATLFGGLSGHGKTLLMLSLVRALLSGEGTKLWGYFDVLETTRRVLYLIPESAIGPFKHRLKLFGLYDYLRDDRLLVRTLSKGPAPQLDDPRILRAAEGSAVFLDTAVRFAEGDENSAGDNQRGLAADFFALLGAGASLLSAAVHSPKPFAKENVMRLENVLRGTGDIGAMAATAFGLKQLDAAQNIIHVENVKPRDFEPPGPFQLVGRPFIDREGDFRMCKRPGDCGSLMDEQEPERDKGGAPVHVREARAANIELLRGWLREDPDQTSDEIAARFAAIGISLSPVTVRKYKTEAFRTSNRSEGSEHFQ